MLNKREDRSMTNEASVVVERLYKSYGAFQALRGISFSVAKGETFALLGPNGAGKSTTVEILEGFKSPSSGSVKVLGQNPARGSRDWRSRIGVVPQSTGAFGPYTVREQIQQFASYYPAPRDVSETINAVGLDEKASTRISSLSGGQRRRVDVALSVIGNPEMLFLDEPTTGFDPEARHEFWNLIRALQNRGTSILLTTHYLEEAAFLSDRIGIINAGRLIALGDLDSLGGSDARIPIVEWQEGSKLHRERTSEPGLFVSSLVGRIGSEPEQLRIIRPSLEDIYLQLINSDQQDGGKAEPTQSEAAA